MSSDHWLNQMPDVPEPWDFGHLDQVHNYYTASRQAHHEGSAKLGVPEQDLDTVTLVWKSKPQVLFIPRPRARWALGAVATYFDLFPWDTAWICCDSLGRDEPAEVPVEEDPLSYRMVHLTAYKPNGASISKASRYDPGAQPFEFKDCHPKQTDRDEFLELVETGFTHPVASFDAFAAFVVASRTFIALSDAAKTCIPEEYGGDK